MSAFREFMKACPEGLRLCEHPADRPADGCEYKYYVCGKGCTLGVLFEDSVNVYFEWLTENGAPVAYAPPIRYKAWPKREVARLVAAGVWEVEGAAEPA